MSTSLPMLTGCANNANSIFQIGPGTRNTVALSKCPGLRIAPALHSSCSHPQPSAYATSSLFLNGPLENGNLQSEHYFKAAENAKVC